MRHRTDRQDPVTVMSEDADKDEDTTAEADFIAIHREGFEAGLAKLRLACKKPTSGSFSKHKYDSMVVALQHWDTISDAERKRRKDTFGSHLYTQAKKYEVEGEGDSARLKYRKVQAQAPTTLSGRKQRKKRPPPEPYMQIVHDGEKFDALSALHCSNGIAGHVKGKTLSGIGHRRFSCCIYETDSSAGHKARRVRSLRGGAQ